MAIFRPYSVVIRASEIPEESILGSPVPKMVIRLKVLIMPVTVPSKPSRGAQAAVKAMKGSSRSRRGLVWSIFS